MDTNSPDFRKEARELLERIQEILRVHRNVDTGLDQCLPITMLYLREMFEQGSARVNSKLPEKQTS